jgi:non-reducing end alpha-L-arabinofuranosidase
MSNKTRLRVGVLLLSSALVLAGCSDYASIPVDAPPGPSGAGGSIGVAGAGGNSMAGTTGASAASPSTEGNPMVAGIAGATSVGVGGAANTGLDAGVAGAAGSDPGTAVRGLGPCDVYAAANTPCVSAYSMVRALSSTYGGPLYQVRRGAPNPTQNTGVGGETQDIGLLANGFADAAAQIAFCANQTCTVSTVYDQSGQGNNLTVAKAGCYGCDLNPPDTACADDFESIATAASLTVGGNAVYGLFMEDHEGYRNNQAVNTPEGEEEMGAYSVVAGIATRPQVLAGCCWNFGIASRDNCFGPTGMMASLMFGTGYWGRGAGNGPWFMGDFEAGVWAGGTAGRFANEGTGDPGEPWPVNQNNPSMTMDYAFGLLKTRPNNYALRMGDAQQGPLTTAYDGATPATMARWQMEGGIVLGIGGDNSNHGSGTFFEGVITAGRPSDATDEAVLQNVQAAGYGR